MLPASVAAAILRQLALDGTTTLAHVSRDDRRRLSHALVEWPLPVAGSRGYTYAEATAGGVALTEIDAGDDGSRGRARGCRASARFSTSTAGSAASISSGPGRAASSPAAPLAAI